MRKDNPACYECPKTRSKLHHWVRRDDGTSYCIKCDQQLDKADTADVWFDHDQPPKENY